VQDEVDRILEDAGAEEHSESVKKWYDGYHFGNFGSMSIVGVGFLRIPLHS
jgi:hypothetical protein